MVACDRRVVIVRGNPKQRVDKFSAIAAAGARDPAVREAATWAVYQGARFIVAPSPDFVARRCMEFVQGLPYRADPAGSDDHITLPCETLRVGGDCEDLSILLSAMWVAERLTARIRWLPQKAVDQDHVTTQVLIARRWLYGEPTVAGAYLGEDPYVAARRVGLRGHASL